jgi:5'-nucleotidase
MKEKPFILICNDDGINAPGLKHLWNCLHEKYEVAIAAPHREKSGSSLATTMLRPLHIFDVKWEKNTPAWKITGTPTDTIKLALSVLLKKKPDIVVSGINRGSNAGQNVLYSGTVGCIIESVLRNIPGIAFSCFELKDPPYKTAENYIPHIVEYFLNHSLPKGTLINVTFPKKELEIKGMKLARQGLSKWTETPDERLHPEGHYYYWLGGKHKHIEKEDNNNDTYLLNKGYITAAPIQIERLTDEEYIKTTKDNFDKIFENIKTSF